MYDPLNDRSLEFYHLMGHMSNSEKALAEKSCPIDDHQSDKLIIDQT